MLTVTCIGGDLRHLFLAQILAHHQYFVQIIGLPEETYTSFFYDSSDEIIQKNITFLDVSCLPEAIQKSQIILGPIPLTKDEHTITGPVSISLESVLSLLTPSQYVIAGMISARVEQFLTRKHIGYYDYLTNDSFARLNAIATAEGSISYAIEHSVCNLHFSNVLILGYGICGSVLAHKLHGLQAQITIAGRSLKTKAEVESAGFHYQELKTLAKSNTLSSFQYIFNTVPALVLSKKELQHIAKDCLILDIASAPGGVDYQYAARHKCNAVLYLGIPGKIAPRTSAQILFDIILTQLQERSSLYVPKFS